MSGDGGRNLDTGHLPTNDENLAPVAVVTSYQGRKTSIRATVNSRYLHVANLWGYAWLPKVTRSDQEIIEGVLLCLAIRCGGDLPCGSPLERYWLSPLDPRPKDQFGILAISRPISMQITADLPCSGELRIRVLPSQVTKMHGVLALVCQHKGVERAGGVGVIPS